MNLDDVKKVTREYLANQLVGVLPAKNLDDTNKRLEHIAFMCEEIQKMEDLERACRWLGFIQGWMWAAGHFSIDEMRKQNNPEAK